MSYKIVKITTYYTNFLNNYYKTYSHICNENYDTQYKHLMSRCFGYSNFYSENFKKIGVDAYEIIINATCLQTKWAEEKGSNNIGLKLFIEQLNYYKPEVLFVQDSLYFSAQFIRNLKKEVKSLKLIFGHICSPFSNKYLEVFKEFDFMLSCSGLFVDKLNNAHVKTFEVKHAFETAVLDKIGKEKNKKNKIFFSGSFMPSMEFHDERKAIVEKIISENIGIDIFSPLKKESLLYYKAKASAFYLTKGLAKLGLKNFLNKIPQLSKILDLEKKPAHINFKKEFLKKVQPPVFGIEMFKQLAKYNIGLNIHGGIAGDFAANIRMFETTGIGACLLTDYKKNIKELFSVDTEVVTYRNVDECLEKSKWLLANPIKAQQIAKAGQKRTLKEHTFYARAQQIDRIISAELKKVL